MPEPLCPRTVERKLRNTTPGRVLLARIPAASLDMLLRETESEPCPSPLVDRRLVALGVAKLGHRLQIQLALRDAKHDTTEDGENSPVLEDNSSPQKTAFETPAGRRQMALGDLANATLLERMTPEVAPRTSPPPLAAPLLAVARPVDSPSLGGRFRTVPLDVLRPRSDAVLDAWFRELGVSVFDRMRLLDALRGRIAGYMRESSQPYEFRPDLLCHREDARNIVCVRDWASGLDNMRGYDIINENPCVEIVLNCKRDEDSMQAVYSPKIRLTWYIENDWKLAFCNIVMPTLFIFFASVVNSYTLGGVFYHPKNDDVETDGPHGYLAITIHLGLTLSVIIPTLAKSDSIRNEFGINQLIGAILFLGIILGSIGAIGINRNLPGWIVVHVLSWVCLAMGIVITPVNGYRFMRMKRIIRDHAPEKAGPATFLGRPGSSPNCKGSDANLSTLTPFWAMSNDGKVEINPALLEGDLWKASKDASGDVTSVYAGLRFEDLTDPALAFGQERASRELNARSPDSRSLLRRGSEDGYFVLEA